MKVPGSGGNRSVVQPDYGWVSDAAYLPTLDEARAVHSTQEGNEALYHYYRPEFGPERFEVWTQEYIAELSNHIVRTMVQSRTLGGTILEVGAGDGRLAGHLRDRICAENIGALVVATDLEPAGNTHFPVEALDQKEALEKHEPTIVLSSWMPLGEEWTWAMRATPSVKAYVLIGAPAMTGTISAWRGYASPEVGEFNGVQLHELDKLKVGQFSDADIPFLSLTRGFQRAT